MNTDPDGKYFPWYIQFIKDHFSLFRAVGGKEKGLLILQNDSGLAVGDWALPGDVDHKEVIAGELPLDEIGVPKNEREDFVKIINEKITEFLDREGGDPNRPRYEVWEYETVDGGDGLNFALGGKCALANTIGNARQRAYDLAGSRRGQKFAVVKPDGSIDVVWLAE